MRNIVILAAFMVGLGTLMAQVADKMTPAPALAHPTSQNAAAAETPVQTVGRSLSIPRDARGHFKTEGRIDGQRLGFMVDTGASVIALNETSAARFGLRPSPGDYNATVTTANGTIKAARTRLAMVDVGGLVVRDAWSVGMRRLALGTGGRFLGMMSPRDLRGHVGARLHVFGGDRQLE